MAVLSRLARAAARSAARPRGVATSAPSTSSASATEAPPTTSAGFAGGVARTAVAVGLAAATACVVEDVLNDLVLWRICVARASPVVESHPRLQRSLGAPFRVEPWWNGSVSSRGNGNLASCVYLVDGERASCDVQVVLVRAPGSAHAYVPNLVRNLAAPEQWRVARMEAILPHEKKAGLPGRVNLLQEEPEPKGGARENRRKGDRRDRRSFFRKRWRGLKGWFERSRGRAKPSDDGR